MIILFYMHRIITEGLEDILSSSFEFYKKLFGVDSFRKIQINFFDDLGKFREFIYDLRGENDWDNEDD